METFRGKSFLDLFDVLCLGNLIIMSIAFVYFGYYC